MSTDNTVLKSVVESDGSINVIPFHCTQPLTGDRMS